MKKRISVLCAVLTAVMLLSVILSACGAAQPDRSTGNWLEGEYVLTGMRDSEEDYTEALSLLDEEETLTIDADNRGTGTLGGENLDLKFDPYSDQVDDGTGVPATYTVDGDSISITQEDFVLVYTKK